MTFFGKFDNCKTLFSKNLLYFCPFLCKSVQVQSTVYLGRQIKLLSNNLHLIESAPICLTSVVRLTSSCYTHSSVVGVVSSLKTFLKPASFRHLPDKNSGRFLWLFFQHGYTLWNSKMNIVQKAYIKSFQNNFNLWDKTLSP